MKLIRDPEEGVWDQVHALIVRRRRSPPTNAAPVRVPILLPRSATHGTARTLRRHGTLHGLLQGELHRSSNSPHGARAPTGRLATKMLVAELRGRMHMRRQARHDVRCARGGCRCRARHARESITRRDDESREARRSIHESIGARCDRRERSARASVDRRSRRVVDGAATHATGVAVARVLAPAPDGDGKGAVARRFMTAVAARAALESLRDAA